MTNLKKNVIIHLYKLKRGLLSRGLRLMYRVDWMVVILQRFAALEWTGLTKPAEVTAQMKTPS